MPKESLRETILQNLDRFEQEPWPVLAKAQERVNTNQSAYGSPHGNFKRTADILTALGFEREGCPVTPMDIALLMVALKLARASGGEGKLDNWVDIAGYAACAGVLFDDFSI